MPLDAAPTKEEPKEPTTLLEFMESERAAAKADEQKAEPKSEPEIKADDEVAPAEPEPEVEPEGDPVEPDAAPEPKSAAEVAYLRSVLEKAGFSPEGIPEDQLEEIFIRELRGEPSQSTRTPEVKDESPAVLPDKDVEESEGGGASGETTETGRSVSKLEYDAKLAGFVTFDENGKAVPREEFGDAGREAASKINEYSAARRLRAEQMVNDPIGYLMADLKKEMQSLVGDELNRFRSEQQAESQQAMSERLAAEERARVASAIEENKARLYVLGTDGEPRRLLKSKEPIFTDFGREVDAEFRDLKELNPNAKDSVLLDKAMRTVERIMPTKSKEDTQAAVSEKKRKFLESERTNDQTDREASREPATLDERLELGADTSLLQLVLGNPDLIDNPVVAKLRQQK